MSILSRFSSIIKANINELLDRCENPAKMIDQYLRELTESLAEVKQETAGVMAEETRTKRLVDENSAAIAKYEDLARKALLAGSEEDARVFLGKKQETEEKREALMLTYEAAQENARKMRQMHDKLVNDIETLNARREMIKAKVAVAKTQDKVNQFTAGADKAESAIHAFDRMEKKADQMLDQSNAMQELNRAPVDEAGKLEEKYAKAAGSVAVDAELARLKAELDL